jgi:hypothetical protein
MGSIDSGLQEGAAMDDLLLLFAVIFGDRFAV